MKCTCEKYDEQGFKPLCNLPEHNTIAYGFDSFTEKFAKELASELKISLAELNWKINGIR